MCNLRLLVLPLMCTVWSIQAADPTQPPDWMAAGGSTSNQEINKDAFNLQQILVSKTHRSAVINNYLVTKGSRVDGARVVAIKKDSVVLEISQKHLTLSLLNTTKQAVKIRRNNIGK